MTGWVQADRLFADQREEIEQARDVSIQWLSEAIGNEIHHEPKRITCPSPDHHQTGHSAPASVFRGGDGVERWKCHGCDLGGDAITLVEHAEGLDFYDAVDRILSLDGIDASWPPVRGPLRHHAPEDPDRLRRVTDERWLDRCHEYCRNRGWYPGLDTMLKGQWEFVGNYHGCWLRLFWLSHDREWWCDRAVTGQTKQDGTEWRWRFPAGRPLSLLWWQPNYSVTVKVDATRPGGKTRWRNETRDLTPDPLPLTLVTEGGSDFATVVVAQHYLPVPQRFCVIGLPGAGNSSLLEDTALEQLSLAVIVDNDEAGDRCRDAIDAIHAVRHLEVPQPHTDASDSWAAAFDPERPWKDDLRKAWIAELRAALKPSESES